MKRLFSTALVLLALLALTTGTAYAGYALELLSVDNNSGGPTFTFWVKGEFSVDELNSGFVHVEGGDDFPLYCSQTDEDTVVCHTSKKVGGHDVVVGFGGTRFWTSVKEYNPPSCSTVFDWNVPQPYTHWQAYGEVCAKGTPDRGDKINFFVPYFGTSTYAYYPYGSTDGEGAQIWAPAGPGYYFP